MRPPASLKAGPPASRAVPGKIFAEFFCAKFPWIPAYPRLWVRSGDDRDTRQFERGRPPGTERLRAAHSRPFAGRAGRGAGGRPRVEDLLLGVFLAGFRDDPIRQVGELLAIEQTRSEVTIAAMRAEMTGLFAALRRIYGV
jgi:hypothetical protein